MSHGDGEEDLGAMAWPGFVDILSSVMIMFVFFLMITATALNFHTLIFKSKMLKANEIIIASKVKKEVDTQNQSIMAENAALKAQLQQVAQAPNPLASQDQERKAGQVAEMLDTKDQTFQISSADKSMTVFFNQDAITLTDKVSDAVIKFIGDNAGRDTIVTVISSRNTADLQEMIARKVTISRMFNVRNSVMKAKIPPDRIAVTMVDGQPVNGTADWVKIVLKSKGS